MKRRSVHALVALWFAVASVVVPVRQAHALVPVAMAMALVNSAGAVIASDALAAAGTALLGGLAMAAIFYTPGDNPVNPSGSATRVPLNSNTPNSAMPAPSAAASTSTVVKYTAGGSTYSTFSAACSGAVAYQTSVNPPPTNYTNSAIVNGSSCYLRQTYTPTGSYTDYLQTIGTTTGCPNGYVVSGSSCALSNPRAATPDKNYDLSRSGSAIADPGTTGEADAKPANVAVNTSGAGQIWGVDSSGRPFVTTITPLANGGSTIQTQVQTSASTVTTSTYTTAADASITNATSTVNAGSVSTSTAAGAVPAVTTGTQAQPIIFPDDYARETTAARTAAAVEALNRTAAAPSDPATPDGSGFTGAFFNGTFNNLLGWSMPAHSSACPQPSFTWNSTVYTFSSHCQLVADHFGTLQAAMGVVWTIAALFILLAA